MNPFEIMCRCPGGGLKAYFFHSALLAANKVAAIAAVPASPMYIPFVAAIAADFAQMLLFCGVTAIAYCIARSWYWTLLAPDLGQLQ